MNKVLNCYSNEYSYICKTFAILVQRIGNGIAAETSDYQNIIDQMYTAPYGKHCYKNVTRVYNAITYKSCFLNVEH